MIITESFVWINYPKTASTFVRFALRKIYHIPHYNVLKRFRMRGRWMEEVLLPENRVGVGERKGVPSPHGTRRQIPSAHLGKPVVSAIRCPVDRCASLYRYGDWKLTDQIPAPMEVIHRMFPLFPDIQFNSFVEYISRFYSGLLEVEGKVYELGPQSCDFLAFFCDDENQKKDRFVFDTWSNFKNTLNGLRLLNSNNINRQLYDLLAEHGLRRNLIDFVLLLSPINQSRTSESSFFIDNSVASRIISSEWLIQYFWEKTNDRGFTALEALAANHALPRI